MEERYGSFEMIDSVLKVKFLFFLKLLNKDWKKFYDLVDIFVEIEVLKEDDMYGFMFLYFDIFIGIGFIVCKLLNML